MKKLLYKGIEFDDFQLYRETENSSGCEYGYPTDENLNTKDWEEADVYICPHCIKKYGFYEETDLSEKQLEQIIFDENSGIADDFICCVDGCYNKNAFDINFKTEDCKLIREEKHNDYR